jgi:hypothetical protein
MILMNSIQWEWREGKVRPIPGNSPHDRPVSRGFLSPRRICDDPLPATPHPPQATPARPFCVFQAWRNLSVRWSSKPKSQTKTSQTRAGVPPPVGRPPMPGKGRDGRNNAPCSSSAMSSGRLFLDRVARQQSPSPLHRQPQIIMLSQESQAKDDISTLPERRHFYFALTNRHNSLWQQSDNVAFEQSRNVVLTAPNFGDAGRTTTDDASRS